MPKNRKINWVFDVLRKPDVDLKPVSPRETPCLFNIAHFDK